MLRTVVCVSLSLAVASAAFSAGSPVISAGTHVLLPNQADQLISIHVSGDVLVQGLEFNAQIGDRTSGPVFQDVDILTGTIFAPSNDGIFPGSYKLPRLVYQGTTTVHLKDVGYGPGYVNTNGLLATLTVDTTGIFSGSWDLLLAGTDEGDTNFADPSIVPIITNGTIVVPEPVSLSLFALGSLALLRRRVR